MYDKGQGNIMLGMKEKESIEKNMERNREKKLTRQNLEKTE